MRWGFVGLALCVVGCSSAPADSGSVEIEHWWTSSGEGQALSALLQMFMRQHPQQTIIDTGVTAGGTEARKQIRNRMLDGNPPETFQANGGWDLLAWVYYNGRTVYENKLDELNALAASAGWRTAIPAPILDTVSVKTATGSDIYAVPLNVHRVNTLYYNKRVLAAAGYTAPPDTIDGLFQLAAALKAAGVTPFAVGMDPGMLPLYLFESFLVARGGGDFYHRFFRGDCDPFDVPVVAALEDLRAFLSYSDPLHPLVWSTAVDKVGAGEAAMTIMGDWAKGQLLSKLPNLDDIGEVPTPGTAGTFVFTTDTFGLPKGARNKVGAQELLRLFGSKEGQDVFNPLKGSISARMDADISLYPHSRQTIMDFRAATLVPATAVLAPPEFMTVMTQVLSDFAAGTDPDRLGNASLVLHTLDNYYDVLVDNPLK